MHAFVNHFLAFEAILVDKSVHEQTFAVLFAGIERDGSPCNRKPFRSV